MKLSTVVGLAIAAIGALTSTTAQAWGVCNRGAWVDAFDVSAWSEKSYCSCGFLAGEMQYNNPGNYTYLRAYGPDNGGVGTEVEVYNNFTNERLFMPMYISGSPNDALTRFANEGGYSTYTGFAPWYNTYLYRVARMRVVCVNNLANFETPSEPWFWD